MEKQKRKKIFCKKHMCKGLAAAIVCSCVYFMPGSAEAAPTESPMIESDSEIIVVYDDADVSGKESDRIQKQAEESLEDLNIEVSAEVTESNEQQGTIVVAEIPEEMDMEKAIESVQKDEHVKYAQPNFSYRLLEGDKQDIKVSGINDPLAGKYRDFPDENYLEDTQVLKAWEYAKTEGDVAVAVLDTGCRLDHEDLKDNILKSYAYDAHAEKPLTASGQTWGGDATGHGTAVCGLIAARADNQKGIAGTSYNASIIPVKIFDNYGDGATTETLLRGIEYCRQLIESGKVPNLRILNMSLGYYGTADGEKDSQDLLLQDSIAMMKDHYNVLTVCAGGNGDEVDTPWTIPMYPSDFEECLSVTSLDGDGKNSPWSDYNEAKDISAPGSYLMSADCGGSASYAGDLKGTSMSAPIVSGICALLWAQNPGLSVEEVVAAIETTADPVAGSEQDGRADGKGVESGSHGAVNAAEALAYISGTEGSGTQIMESDITGLETQYVYTGGRITPSLKITSGGAVLKKNRDYTLRYENNTEVGEAKVTITGIGTYSGVIVKNFRIVPKDLQTGRCVLSLQKESYVYEGEPVCPKVTVTAPITEKSSIELKEGIDYEVTYAKNTGYGTASVEVSGINNYTGSLEKTYEIIKKAEDAKPSGPEEEPEDNREESVDDESEAKEIKPMKSSDTKKTRTKDEVRTGDESRIFLWVCLIVISSAGIAGAVFYKSRKRK